MRLQTLTPLLTKMLSLNNAITQDTMPYQGYARQIATRVLVSDCVDNVIEANEIYAQRNNVEVGYSIIKGELGGSTLNASTDKTVNAKVFILSLASEVQRQMLEANKDR